MSGGKPLHPLEDIQAALEEGGVLIGNQRCRSNLLSFLQSMQEAQAFAEAVIATLTPGCFYKVQQNPGSDFAYDAYGVSLGPELVERFGVEERQHWYLGVQLTRKRSGRKAVLVTIHEPERDILRADGTIVPGASEEDGDV